MLKSLQSGVSGLMNHQMKIDVLGNNIANVNTVGYKGGRIMFSETLSQTIQSATPATGNNFINPIQVGLGMNTTAIQNVFTQGSLEQTGVKSDLAIEGDGFFIVKSGNTSAFTRAGNFFFNAEGKLINQKGLSVQGWMNPDRDTIGGLGLGNTEEIIIDKTVTSPSKATENVFLTGNLNAGNRTIAEIWESPKAMIDKAIVAGTAAAPTFPMTITAGTNDQLNIVVQDNATSQLTGELTLTAGSYANIDALVTEINEQIKSTSNISTRVEAVNNGGTLQFHQVNGSETTNISIENGTNSALATLGFTDGDNDTASIVAATSSLNNILGANSFSQALQDGDNIAISGTNPDGTIVTANFTFGAANDGTTVGDLVSTIQSSFNGVTVTLEDGKIVVTDDAAGDSKTTINLSNDATNTGSITFPGFTNTVPGHTGTATTSVLVYDSLGASHNIIFKFTNTENANEWTWEAEAPGGAELASGQRGRVTFNNVGAITSFTHDGGVNQLTLNPGNGAEQLDLIIHSENSEEYSGLSQFDSVTTLSVREQDGKTTGELIGINIGNDGIISGSFTNGEIENLAKIAVAQFPNNIGLSDLGDGLYSTSLASGDPKVVNPASDVTTRVVSGALEMSNVDLSREMTELITAQRGFQANAKIITTADSILDELIRLKR